MAMLSQGTYQESVIILLKQKVTSLFITGSAWLVKYIFELGDHSS